MRMKRGLCWILALVLLACLAHTSSTLECDVSPKLREDCGFGGISAETCRARGCCFDSSIKGVIWCFHPKSSPAPEPERALECDVSPKLREDCGFAGISAETCRGRGCCFDSSIKGVIWCFHPKVSPAPEPELCY